jgi:uncharacterized protein YdhG (YjbR/CyaY superfamily)
MRDNSIDEYLADLPIAEQQALQKLREIIHSIVPKCKERIAYKICVFSVNKDLVGFASQKHFLSFYTMSPLLVKDMKKELEYFEVSGATIHFTPESPIPESLIRRIVKERLKQVNY